MAYVQADRVQETTTTTGTGTLTLAGAVTGYRTFGSQMVNGDTCYYVIIDAATGAWESGIGTWSTGGSLARTTVVESSNSNAAVSFAAGSKNVFMAQIAKGALILPAASSSQPSMVMTPGSAPSSPANGFMWLTAAGLFMVYGGNVYGPMLGPTSGVATLEYNAGSPALVLQNLAAAGYSPALIRMGRRGAGDTATPNGSAVGDVRWEIKDAANAYQQIAGISVSIGTNAPGGAPTDMTFSTSQGAAGQANALTLGSDQRAKFFGVIMPMAGTTGKAPFSLDPTSVLKTTPAQGDVEYDGAVRYFTPNGSSGRALDATQWFYRVSSAVSLTSGTGVQSLLGVGQTLPIGRYLIEMFVMLATGTTAHTVALGLGGTATWTASGCRWFSEFVNVAAAGTPTAAVHKWNTTLTNGTPQVVSPSSSIASKFCRWQGTLSTSGAGTVIPQIQFGTAPTGTNETLIGTWVRIQPIDNNVGLWA